ncbi:hypothetical protein DRO51_00585 [Candidatus Bathyarchaeota archaeon]|nr:MAG: hypothetical protein DRO51_00585 [Candidatus Bathyarchaeota archaeon]
MPKFLEYASKLPKVEKGLEKFIDSDYKILDVTAGFRKFWIGKDTTQVLFLDIRKECKPDIVADNEHLPLRDNLFEVVFYDPPHLFKQGETFYRTRFGLLYYAFKTKHDFLKNLKNVNIEASRVLKKDGKLIVKWSCEDEPKETLPLQTLIAYMKNFKLEKIEEIRNKHHTGNYKAYLVTFIKHGEK